MIIKNMINILEEVAREINNRSEDFVYLSDVIGNKREAMDLWKLIEKDSNVQENEQANIAVRSLLSRKETKANSEGKKWPVEFFQRSMYEYFLARCITRLIVEDSEKVQQIFSKKKLANEIIDFASLILKKKNDWQLYEDALLKLLKLTKNCKDEDNSEMKNLGCNSINLLYKLKRELPGKDWTNLILDEADLTGADLSGKNFSGTSLKLSRLDNVILEETDFSNANLTGALLGETTPVQSFAIMGNSSETKILALYNNFTIREWKHKHAHNVHSIVAFACDTAKESPTKMSESKIVAYPEDNFVLFDKEFMTFGDRQTDQFKITTKFEINPKYTIQKIKDSRLLLIQEEDEEHILNLIDLDTSKVIHSHTVEPHTIADNLGDTCFITYLQNQGIRVIGKDLKKLNKKITEEIKVESTVTCLASKQIDKDSLQFLVGFGFSNGEVQCWKVDLEKQELDVLVNESQAHSHKVTDIRFCDKKKLVSGGYDKKIILHQFDEQNKKITCEGNLILSIECEGIKFDNVKSEKEKALLTKLSKRYETIN